MKRPPGLWLLLSAGVLWLCFQDVSCVRATSLIFAKSTTTTSTAAPEAEGSKGSEGEGVTEEIQEITPKSNFTGIPQQDYRYDPNLPRELNGANLTEYPFFDRVPEEIDFKCDGLHDGFYASVEHKCQVYHHCLYGTRYDFLCANYTAFDQKTFICHFVSEVDCVNSKKFWHRNDALYEATTTTTIKPMIVYTPPAPPAILGGAARRPAGAPALPNGRRRKPMRRRRPQYDYYEDYEEESDEYYDEPRYTATESSRNTGRRKRPRPRPRPIYDDEYEEYEDERYERRRGTTRRGEEERERRPYRGRPSNRRNKDDKRKFEEEYEEEEDEDPRFDRSEEKKNKKPKEDRRTDERKYEKRRQDEEEKEERPVRPRKSQVHRRPAPAPAAAEDEYEDEIKEERRPGSKKNHDQTTEETKPSTKPSSGASLFDRPRVPPRVRPPVPKSEADKYAYKTTSAKPKPKLASDEYYDDYEEEPLKRSKPDSTSASSTDARKSHLKPRGDSRESRKPPRRPPPKKPAEEEYEYEEEEERPRRIQKPKNEERRVGQGSRKRPASNEYEDYEEDRRTVPSRNPNFKDRKYLSNKEEPKPRTTSTTTSTTTTTTSTTTTTTEATAKEEPKSSVRILKRPFLPSRGGNPYSPRGLQPVGLKSETTKQPVETRKEIVKEIQQEEIFKPSPIIVKVPIRSKYTSVDDEEDFRPVSNRPVNPSRYKPIKELDSRSTQKPKPIEKNPLDIIENEYDVTLNDALNPTLPNLPVRSFPTGFSVANDYTFSAFQRPRYVVDATINQASSQYNYRFKAPSDAQQSLRNDAQYNNGQNYQNFRPSPRVTHTQAFYNTY